MSFSLFLQESHIYSLLSIGIYIVVDIILYPYTLPIDLISTFYSSLYLSCNLSQA